MKHYDYISSENPMIKAYSNSCGQKHHAINYPDTTVTQVHLQTESNTQFRAHGSINQLKETLNTPFNDKHIQDMH